MISLFASVGYEKKHGSDLRTSLGCTGDVTILLITVPTKSMIRVIVRLFDARSMLGLTRKGVVSGMGVGKLEQWIFNFTVKGER